MLTRPNVSEPFQSARAIGWLPASALPQLALGPQPVFEIHSVFAATLDIDLVGASPNLLVARGGIAAADIGSAALAGAFHVAGFRTRGKGVGRLRRRLFDGGRILTVLRMARPPATAAVRLASFAR